jgi:ribonuclease HII
MLSYEKTLWHQGMNRVAGVDEVGRGPLAGPVVAAAVVFPQDISLNHVTDSKKLTPQKRAELFDLIFKNALDIGIGQVDQKDIDQLNILNASLKAMHQAIDALKNRPDAILVDGNQKIPNLRIPQIAIVKGDSLSLSVAAASILAKVTRDKMMLTYHRKYPHFFFDQNKGYATKSHIRALKEHGPCKIHRMTFRSIKMLKMKQERISLN